ncbi:MAG: glycosyltransferase [Bacteroidetes bacterium SW_11_64_17]|nr:MAG: glycosyltransferase [Bacteroidetes bacterium SW_11_64_17]
MDASLLVFAKVPRPGAVKTRLTPALTPEEAARVYMAFLRDTLRQVVQLEVDDMRLYLAPPLPDDEIDGVPAAVSVHEQTGDGMGARMHCALRETLRDGADRAVLMGSDHPTLPSSFLRQAFRSLEEARSLCVGPTEDGGFYLLGMSTMYPQLFDGMSYSHSEVFADTVARAQQTDAEVTVLPEWYDVDTPQDLDRMQADLATDAVEAPNTRRIAGRLRLETISNRTSDPT